MPRSIPPQTPVRLIHDARGKRVEVRLKLNADWSATYHIVSVGGAPAIGEVRVYSANEIPRDGLTVRTLREAECLGAVLAVVRRTFAWMADGEIALARQQGLNRRDPFGEGGILAEFGFRASSHAPAPRDQLIAQAAGLYVAALEQADQRRRPLVFVGKRMKIAPEAARQLIHEARQRGLLLPRRLQRGHIAGELTQAAIDILEKGTDHAK